MRLHELRNTVPRQARKRVGRGQGSGLGGTSGKGHKGDKARKGAHIRPYFEGGQIPLIRRLPKRGFKNPDHKYFAVINVATLATLFAAGEVVSVETLQAKGWLKKLGAGLKVLGNGEIAMALTVKAKHFSAGAKAKIEAAGGTCEIV